MGRDSEPDVNTIGGRLRAARLGAGMSQADVAVRSGIPKPQISRYENNHVEPSITSLVRLCVTIGQPPSAIIDHLYEQAVTQP